MEMEAEDDCWDEGEDGWGEEDEEPELISKISESALMKTKDYI